MRRGGGWRQRCFAGLICAGELGLPSGCAAPRYGVGFQGCSNWGRRFGPVAFLSSSLVLPYLLPGVLRTGAFVSGPHLGSISDPSCGLAFPACKARARGRAPLPRPRSWGARVTSPSSCSRRAVAGRGGLWVLPRRAPWNGGVEYSYSCAECGKARLKALGPSSSWK